MPHIAGQSIWQELEATDPTGLEAFYRAVLGWDLRLDGRTGHFLHDGTPVAGLRIVDTLAPKETNWKVYLATDDLDTALDRAAHTGAQILDKDTPLTIPGRAAKLRDPFGAAFGLASLPDGTGAPATARRGRLALVDAMTPDVDAARAFCDTIVERRSTSMEAKLRVYRDDAGTALFGINELSPEELKILPPHWLPWFVVTDEPQALEAAQTHGGRVNTAHNTFLYGTWGVISDPSGGTFKALQLTTDKL